MSALKPSQLEELVQKRRNEQDLDLESYIKAKNEILGYITNFKFKQLDEKGIVWEKLQKYGTGIKCFR